MSAMSFIRFIMFVLYYMFYFLFGQVKLAIVLIVATFETLEEMYEDLDLYIRYDLHEFYHSLYDACAYEIEVLQDDDHRHSTLAVLFLLLLFLLYAGFIAPTQPPHGQDNVENTAANGTVPLAGPKDLADTPATSSAPPPPLPTYTIPAFPYEHFNGTGESFQPHRQPDIKKNGTAHNFRKDTFLNEEVEAKYGFTRKYDRFKGHYWAYKAPTTDKWPSIATTIEVPVERHDVVQAAKQPEEDIVAAPPARDIAAPPVFAPPPPPGPIMAPTTVPAPRGEASPAEASQPPPPPPPRSFEMVCGALALETNGLKDAITRFLTVVNSSGDPSGVMLLLGTSFQTAYQALWVHRTQLTLDESKQTGWPGVLEEFYAVVHPNAYWLGTQYNGDMLVFLQAVLALGRFLGLVLPDLDLSPPRAPTPPPVAHAEVPEVYQASAPPPPPAPSAPPPPPAPSAPPGGSVAAAPAPAPPTFSSSGIKPTSSRAPPAASRSPRSAAQRRTAGARHQATPKASHQLPKQPAKKVLDFYDLAAWKDKTKEELAGFTVESFGWSDDKATGKLLWKFTTGLELVLGGSWINGFTAEYIINEIDSKVGALKRAAWVLLWQAQAPFNWKAESDTAPTLLGEMLSFLNEAGQKVDFANAQDSLGDADAFMDFFRFQFNDLGRHSHLRASLAQQYNEADVGNWIGMLREVRKKVDPQ